MSRDVAVSLFITKHNSQRTNLPSVLLDVTKVVTANNNSALHLGRDDKTLKDSSTNGNVGSEGALLINVLATNSSFRSLNTKANIGIPTLVGLLAEKMDLTVRELILLLESSLVLQRNN